MRNGCSQIGVRALEGLTLWRRRSERPCFSGRYGGAFELPARQLPLPGRIPTIGSASALPCSARRHSPLRRFWFREPALSPLPTSAAGAAETPPSLIASRMTPRVSTWRTLGGRSKRMINVVMRKVGSGCWLPVGSQGVVGPHLTAVAMSTLRIVSGSPAA